MNRLLLLISGFLVLISSCRHEPSVFSNEPSAGTEIISRAERIRISQGNGFKTVSIISPWQGAGNHNIEYFLVRRGNKIPDGVDSSKVIYVPLKNIICMSTTHVAMIAALGKEATISGISGTNFVYNENVRRQIEHGLIKDVGYEASLNYEMIIKINPDIVMMYGVGGESVAYTARLLETGIKVMFNADYLESDPLGKAEWIKLFGALYCKEDMSDSIFRAEVKEYENLKDFIKVRINEKPDVLLGLPYKDTWFVSPGNSYISRLISDAGGSYLWKDVKSDMSMPFGLENVYVRAMNAEFWLNAGTASSLREINTIDRRIGSLPCAGNIYNNNKRINKDGGNDYWENGALFPHLILRDMALILHAEIFDEKELYFYRKLF